MAGNIYAWSTTAADNSSADASINWAEGQLPSTVNNSARAQMAAVASLLKDINGTLSTAGSSNAYTIASPNIAYAAYATGITIGFKANHTNTSAATLSVNSIGNKAIRVFTIAGDTALSGGEIQQNGHYSLRYDSAANSSAGAWILLNPTQSTGTFSQLLIGSGVTAYAAGNGETKIQIGNHANESRHNPGAIVELALTRSGTGALLGAGHGFTDATYWSRTDADANYFAFNATMSFANTHDHVGCFQSGTTIEGTSVITNYFNYYNDIEMLNGASITNLYGFYFQTVAPPGGGTVTVTNAWGAYIKTPTVPGCNFTAIETTGTGPCSFGGAVGVAGVLTVTNTTQAAAIGTAALHTSGGLSVTKDFQLGGNQIMSVTGAWPSITLKRNSVSEWNITADATTHTFNIALAGTPAFEISTSSVVNTIGNFTVATNKFTVAAASGNTVVAGTLGVTGATTLSAALTYGGVTLSNAVTGTGNMVLSASPTLSGTVSAAAVSMSGALTYGGVTLTAAVTGTGSMALSASPTFTGTVGAAAITATGAVGSGGLFSASLGSAKQAIFSGWGNTGGTSSGTASHFNGSIWIGDTASSQGVIDYNGTSGNTSFDICNTYDSALGEIRLRTRTSGTPVTALTATSAVVTTTVAGGMAARNTVKAFGKVIDGTLQSGSFNVSSITDNGSSHTVTFTTAMADANYAIMITHDRENGSSTANIIAYHTVAAGSFRIECNTPTVSGNVDPDSYSFMVLSNE